MHNKSLYDHYKDFAFCHVCGAATEITIICDASDEGPHKDFSTGLNLICFSCKQLTSPLIFVQEYAPHLARNQRLFINSSLVIDDKNSILKLENEGYGNMLDFLIRGNSVGASISCRNGASNAFNHMFNTLHEKINFQDTWLMSDKAIGYLDIEKIYVNYFDNNQNIITIDNEPRANSGHIITYDSHGEFEMRYQPHGKKLSVNTSYIKFLNHIKTINSGNVKSKLNIWNLFS